jgi:hypothetical protein
MKTKQFYIENLRVGTAYLPIWYARHWWYVCMYFDS